MFKNTTNKKISTVFFLGVPVLLLVMSVFSVKKDNIINKENDVNRYYLDMPIKYANALDLRQAKNDKNNQENKSFNSLLIEEKHRKDLIVVKEIDNKEGLTTDFLIHIYPLDKSRLDKNQLFYNFTLTNNAVIYKYHNKGFGLFKFELPYFGIEKITIKQLLRNRKATIWEDTILVKNSKTQKLLYQFNNTNKGEKFKPNIYYPLLISMLKEKGLKYFKQGYVTQNDTLFEVTQNLKQYVDENKAAVINIKSKSLFWKAINKRDKNIFKLFEILNDKDDKLKGHITNYINGEIEFEDLFNINKLATFLAITSIFSNECNEQPLCLSINVENRSLEPVFTQRQCVGEKSNYINKVEITNLNFIRAHITALESISNVNFKELLNREEGVWEEMVMINNNYPYQIFNLDYLKINQLKIKKNLHQSTVIKPELISIDKHKMVLSIFNPSYHPIQILGLNHKGKKRVIALNSKVEIKSKERDTIIVDLPRSFENLFVSKKSKSVGFLLHKHIYDLSIEYLTSGLNDINLASIIPYEEKEIVEKDLFRQKSLVNKHENLVVNDQTKTITFNKKEVTISSPLIISEGYTFYINAGTKVNIVNGGKIISHSPLNFSGTKEQPIRIYSKDKKGQGLLVLSAATVSKIRHVEFEDLSNPKHGSWSVTGAITFYESPVDMVGVLIKNNRCEDALNIVRTKFTLKNSTIVGTQSDAFDGDFVTGTISDCRFQDLGNDAIDISGSDLIIKKVIINNAGDKGLSAGEDSTMKVNNVEITNSEIAIAGKDLSVVEIKEIKISNTKLGFTAFQKKPEFGPSKIIVNGVEMKNIETDYLIESSSSMIVDGQKIETSKNVKERMYGVEFGRSSAETRNIQKQ